MIGRKFVEKRAIFWSRDAVPVEFTSERIVTSSWTQKTFDTAYQDLSNGVDHIFQFHMQVRALLFINQSPVHLSAVYLDDSR